MMTLKEPTCSSNPTMICYDNLTHIPQLNLREQSFIPRSPASLNTLQWLKYVIFPLININIWQKLINRSFTILIYQTMRVWTTINFLRSIIHVHLSIQPNTEQLANLSEEDAQSRIFTISLARALWMLKIYDLWW